MTVNAQRIAGLTTAISGAAILVLAVVSAVAGPAGWSCAGVTQVGAA